MKLERFDLDGQGKPFSEGWFAVSDTGVVILMPPGTELAADAVKRGYRPAVQADVDALPAEPAAKGQTKPRVVRFAWLGEFELPEPSKAP